MTTAHQCKCQSGIAPSTTVFSCILMVFVLAILHYQQICQEDLPSVSISGHFTGFSFAVTVIQHPLLGQ